MAFIVAMFVLLACPHFISYAQEFESRIDYLKTTGSRPVTKSQQFHKFVNDGKGNVWLFTTDGVWSLSIDRLEWTQWPAVRFEHTELDCSFDKANNQFLFWSTGVGEVYTWSPGQTMLQRVDQAYHYRTQFGHAGFVHPATGDIYAFGGYGFWQSKGHTVRYDRQTRDWHLLRLDPTRPYPSPRSLAMRTFDEDRNEFHIFGGVDFQFNGREDLSREFLRHFDYWILDLTQNEWEQRPLYGMGALIENDENRNAIEYSNFYAVADTVHALLWFPIRNTTPPHDIRMMVFDRDRSFGALTGVNFGELGNKNSVHWQAFDAHNNRILGFWTLYGSPGIELDLYVSSLPLPHPDSTRAMMDRIRELDTAGTPQAATVRWLFLGVCMVLGGWLVWNRSRRRKAAAGAIGTLPEGGDIIPGVEQRPTVLTLCYLGAPRVMLNGVELRNAFSEHEFAMLLWLHWKQFSGEPFQITDNIEEIFWPHETNLDYIRKQRNASLRRLNEQLADVLGQIQPEGDWLADRPSLADKRKREYKLNFDSITVTSDLDTLNSQAIEPDDLLKGRSGVWVDRIRSEILSLFMMRTPA